jgi:hypothetical protein
MADVDDKPGDATVDDGAGILRDQRVGRAAATAEPPSSTG